EWLFPNGFRLGSPEMGEKRGSHVTLKHAEAYRISRALIDPECGDRVVLPDFREPNNLRFGITPLYTTYEEIYLAMKQVRSIMEKGLYKKYPRRREMVT
ncbi:MAG: kynureninase/PvdN C-terminal domain-containing protein, partial [Bacteroidales bacterium]